jgi:hypothetical protein
MRHLRRHRLHVFPRTEPRVALLENSRGSLEEIFARQDVTILQNKKPGGLAAARFLTASDGPRYLTNTDMVALTVWPPSP